MEDYEPLSSADTTCEVKPCCHDPFDPANTLRFGGSWQSGSSIRCTSCNNDAPVNRKGWVIPHKPKSESTGERS